MERIIAPQTSPFLEFGITYNIHLTELSTPEVYPFPLNISSLENIPEDP